MDSGNNHSTEFAALELLDKTINLMNEGEVPISVFFRPIKSF